MKFHPILFSTEMVQAILEGRKTQTRRVVKKKYSNTDLEIDKYYKGGKTALIEIQNNAPAPRKNLDGSTTHTVKAYKECVCPFGNVGDVLWVRETFIKSINPNEFIYKSDCDNPFYENPKWKPSIFMPKQACRIFLKVKSIKVERLIDITKNDAIAEGIPAGSALIRINFFALWKEINGAESLVSNPWVWVIEFERLEKPENFI